MALSNAERQRLYRKRRSEISKQKRENGFRRLEIWIHEDVMQAIDDLDQYCKGGGPNAVVAVAVNNLWRKEVESKQCQDKPRKLKKDELRRLVLEKRDNGLSYHQIALELTNKKILTPQGLKNWRTNDIYNLFKY
ncbi:MAG: hypothetical protein KME36_11080 [Candidatus Thiodiazotropha sp. (ex Lucina pensylvanica)]|nr:hypothetical protein [Candidatus Thiodiazotropha sp. (ex Lucina pensylvanica)]MBT3050647.1 hypothetical protein [Candidatus Thiodiazotropha sp. (ex Codakia orbicularis)]